MPKLQKNTKILNGKNYNFYNISIPKHLIDLLKWEGGDCIKIQVENRNNSTFLVLKK